MAKGELTIVLDKKDYDRVQAALSSMSEVDQKTTVQNALKEGAQVIVNAGKRNLQERNKQKTGNLMRSFTTSVKRKKNPTGYAGFKRSNKQGVKGGNHSYLVSEGTAVRYTKKGYHRGSVSKGRPNQGSKFWSDAVETEGPRALDRVMEAIYEELDKLR